jgi:hypothetical protein
MRSLATNNSSLYYSELVELLYLCSCMLCRVSSKMSIATNNSSLYYPSSLSCYICALVRDAHISRDRQTLLLSYHKQFVFSTQPDSPLLKSACRTHQDLTHIFQDEANHTLLLHQNHNRNSVAATPSFLSHYRIQDEPLLFSQIEP